MNKKIIAAIALSLSTLTLVACGTPAKPSFSANWKSNVLSKEFKATTETLEYSVTFEKNSFLQKDYFTIEYCGENNSKPGTYTTTLEYLDDETYKYTTTLSVPVTYTLTSNSAESKDFTDTVQTETVFKKTDNYLQPIYSKKSAHCYSVCNVKTTNLENAYREYNYEFAISYADDLTSGVLTRTDRSNPRTLLSDKMYPDGVATSNFTIDQKKYIYLDNEQLLFALRGLSNKQISSAKTFLTYNASTVSTETASTTADTAVKTNFTLALNGAEAKDYSILYTPVTLKSGNKNAVLSQELWYAQTTSNTMNEFRNVLLRMKTPIYYGIGYLTYTLKSANFSQEISQ